MVFTVFSSSWFILTLCFSFFSSVLVSDSPLRSDESESENFMKYSDDPSSTPLKNSAYSIPDTSNDILGISATLKTNLGTSSGRSNKVTSSNNYQIPYDAQNSNTLLSSVTARPNLSESRNQSWSSVASAFTNARDRRRASRRSDRTNLSDDLSSVGSHTDDLKLEEMNTSLLSDTGAVTPQTSAFSSKLHYPDSRPDDDEDFKRYCICRDVSYGDMIACDAPDCPYEWFHYACVNLTVAPKGRWYCPSCIKSLANTKHPKKRIRK